MNKALNVVLWILQLLLAAFVIWHGWLFLSPPPELVDIMNAQFAPAFRIFLGVAEVLAGIGLILPQLTRIQPWLTPLAAACMAFVVACASVLHLTRGETSSAIMTAVMCILFIFIAYMRWQRTPAPIAVTQ